MEAFWQILQGKGRNERLHISHRADALLMAVCPVEAQGASPVVQDERQRLRSDQLIDKGVKVAGVAREAVAVGLRPGRDLVRVAQEIVSDWSRTILPWRAREEPLASASA